MTRHVSAFGAFACVLSVPAITWANAAEPTSYQIAWLSRSSGTRGRRVRLYSSGASA